MRVLNFIFILCVIITICNGKNEDSVYNYLIGVGIADITGPAAEVNMVSALILLLCSSCI